MYRCCLAVLVIAFGSLFHSPKSLATSEQQAAVLVQEEALERKAEPSAFEPWLEYFIAPSVVALLVLGVQFLVLPRLEREKTRVVELFKHRKDVFVQAIRLVDQQINAQHLMKLNPTMFKGHVPLNAANTNDVNRIYSDLLLLAENSDVPQAFSEFFASTIGGDILVKRGAFILRLRKELYATSVDLQPEKVPFYINQADTKTQSQPA